MKEIGGLKKSKKSEGEGDTKKDKKKDDEGKKNGKEKKNCCKSCGKDCSDKVEKTVGGEKGEKRKNDGRDSDKKSDEKKSNESKENSYNGGSNNSWTKGQDNKLKEMKEANKSWKEIAPEVGHHQHECKSRYKELRKADEEKSGSDVAAEGGKGDFDTTGSATGSWNNNWNVGDMPSFGDLFVDAPAKDSKKQNNDNSRYNQDNQKGSRGQKQKGKNIGNDGNGGIADKWSQGKQHWAGEEGWSYKSNEPSQQREFPRGRLQHNEIWSKDDCEVLEILEAQYREHKWLHIQAGFFNWTGRMISAELIESKFREDGAA